MTPAELIRRNAASMRAAYEDLMGPAGHVVDVGGVRATVLPAFPSVSAVNAAHYLDAVAVTPAVLDLLHHEFVAAGVRSWSLCTRPGDDARLGPLLRSHGHVPDDEQPLLMAAPIAELDLARGAGVDVVTDTPWAAVGRVLDRAFESDDGHLESILARVAPDAAGVRRWTVDVDGEPGACVVARVFEDEVDVAFVAVTPTAQGRGLASGLLRHALVTCRDIGAVTASLESTEQGQGVYARMGFRPLGRLCSWIRTVEDAR